MGANVGPAGTSLMSKEDASTTKGTIAGALPAHTLTLLAVCLSWSRDRLMASPAEFSRRCCHWVAGSGPGTGTKTLGGSKTGTGGGPAQPGM